MLETAGSKKEQVSLTESGTFLAQSSALWVLRRNSCSIGLGEHIYDSAF